MLRDFQSIGKIGKPFGVQGKLRLSCSDAIIDHLQTINFVFLPRGGHYVPYRIEGIYEEKDWLIKFDGLDSPQEAKECSGNELFLPAKDLPEQWEEEQDDFFFSPIVGYQLIDQNQIKVGEILRIIEMPEQELAVVLHKEEECMIPLHETLVIGIDHSDRIVQLEIAEGLLD